MITRFAQIDPSSGAYSPPLEALRTYAPRIGVPFLEAFRVQHGPPGLLGRFFLSADTRLRERGLTLRFISLEDLQAVRRANSANWGSTNPMFDPQMAEISPGTMCLAGYDKLGVVQACICAKPFDAASRSLAAVFNTGGFFSIRPDLNVNRLATSLDVAAAEQMFGLVGYCAAVWVSPAWRGGRLAAMFANLMYACIYTLWNPSYVIGFVPLAKQGSALHQRYNLPHASPRMRVTSGDTVLDELVLIWMTADETIDALRVFLDEIWPQIDTAISAGDRQQSA